MSANGKSTWMKIGILVLMLGCGVGTPLYGFAGGTGEPNNPYQIATAADLLSIGSESSLLNRHFVLIDDLDLDPNLPGGRVFDDALIGRDSDPGMDGNTGGFMGVFDGQGHTIHHLCISGKHGYSMGLFGISWGLIRDLHLRDVRISGAPCGALAGTNVSQGTIWHCSVTGKVMGSGRVGGLVAECYDGTILHCESRADVCGDAGSVAGGLVGSARGAFSLQIVECRAAGTVTGGEAAGGLIGSVEEKAPIFRCVADCQVRAEWAAGGLIGNAIDGHPFVVDCYVRGSVSGPVAGGLIGDAGDSYTSRTSILTNSYAACEMLPLPGSQWLPTFGGLFGREDRHDQRFTVAGCFWDTKLSGVQVGIGTGPNPGYYGTGLTTEQTQQLETFKQAGWDLGYTWAMSEGSYPVLRWELTENASQR